MYSFHTFPNPTNTKGIEFDYCFSLSDNNSGEDSVYFSCLETCESPMAAMDESALETISSGNSTLMKWSPIDNQIGCQIQLRIANGTLVGTKIITGAEAERLRVPHSLLQSSTSYAWRVRCGCSITP